MCAPPDGKNEMKKGPCGPGNVPKTVTEHQSHVHCSLFLFKIHDLIPRDDVPQNPGSTGVTSQLDKADSDLAVTLLSQHFSVQTCPKWTGRGSHSASR